MGREIGFLWRFHSHFGDHLVQLATDCPVGLAGFPLYILDIAAVANEDFKEVKAFRGEAKKGRKLELADDACAAHGAIQLGDNEWGRTTRAGLGDKWHLGYSNGGSLANFLHIVNSFDEKPNILISRKYIAVISLVHTNKMDAEDTDFATF